MRLTHKQLEEKFPVGKKIQLQRVPVYASNNCGSFRITERQITKTERSDRNGLMVWFKGIKGAFVITWSGCTVWRNYPRQVKYELV